ncbi:hypothetical protein [Nonomuraea sp. B5E05]|uniref:nSTAND1 domain-containing NTPase n=1 Tax=Nonomuraea sp. B5E05 TaxID=3153569 RepID=UPI00325FFA98
MTVSLMAQYVDRQPYVGVRPFYADESEQYFGRSAAADEIADRWLQHPLTVLSGPPGCGKTSLLHAKLVTHPALRAADVLPMGRPAGPPPPALAALPEHNPYTLAVLCSWSPATPPGRLAGLSLYEFLRRDGRADGRSGPLFAAIDQVEKVFERHSRLDQHRAGFLAQLREVTSELPHLRLLLSIRDEHVPGLEIALGSLQPYHLGALTLDEAVQAIERPVAGSGRWYADGVAERIATAVATGHDAVDPVLLQAICSRLWTSLPADTTAITLQDVHAYPGIGPALREFCGQAVADVTTEYDVSTLRVASWLQHAFATPAARGDTAGSATRAGLPPAILLALQDRHILRADNGSYRLHHECLAEPLTRLDVADLRVSGTSPHRHLAAAESALFRGDLATAELSANAALAGQEDLTLLAAVESRLGDIAHLRGDPQQAVTHYRAAAASYEAMRDTPAVANLLAAIAHSLLAQGMGVEAVDAMRSAVDRLPTDLALQTELGRTLWRAGQGHAGVTVLTDVLNTDSGTPEALRTRGEMLADLGQADKALHDLDQVRRHLRPEGRAARALALVSTGNPRDAEEEMEAALEAGTQNGPALLYVARVRALGSNRTGAADLARLSLTATAPALAPHQRVAATQLLRTGSPSPS